jgi:hypothetical protein
MSWRCQLFTYRSISHESSLLLRSSPRLRGRAGSRDRRRRPRPPSRGRFSGPPLPPAPAVPGEAASQNFPAARLYCPHLSEQPAIRTQLFVSAPGTAIVWGWPPRKRNESIATASEMSIPPSGCQSTSVTLAGSVALPSPQGSSVGLPRKRNPSATTASEMSSVPSPFASPGILRPPSH